MCVKESEKIYAALKEYESLNCFYSETYRHYVRCLFFTVIALGGVSAVIVRFASKDFFSLLETFKAELAIAVILLVNLWFTGWAYLNLELWSYRNYLAKLELYMRKETGMKGESDGFSFYSTHLFHMYGTKMPLAFGKVKCSDALTLCFAFPIFIFYVFCICCAVVFLRDGSLINHIVLWLLLIVSILCTIITTTAKYVIGREQEKKLKNK